MKTAFRWLIQFYRLFISPMLGPRCRFYPSCSVYALEALEQHSIGNALWLIIKRLARCQPWGGSGYDPVPPRSNRSSKTTDLKKNSFVQSQLIHFFSSHQMCHCEAEKKVFKSQRDQQIVKRHQNCKFTPYTNPPHQPSLFI